MLVLAPALVRGAPAPQPKAAELLDRQPYRIRVSLTIDPAARFDISRRNALIADWRALLHRFIGAPWEVEIAAPQTQPVALESVQPQDVEAWAQNVDKVWLIRLSANGSGLTLA